MPTTQATDPETWLAGLNGQTPNPEAALLRRLVQANPTPEPALNWNRREAFISGLRSRGAFQKRGGNAGFKRWISQIVAARHGYRLALAASIAVLGIGLNLTWRLGIEQGAEVTRAPYADPDIVMRGDEQAQRMITPNPRTLANQIGEVLVRHQLPLRRVENGPLVQIQAKVPVGHPARMELERLNIHVPPHGRLNLLLVQG